MNIVVLVREVPDLLEELEVLPDGTDIDRMGLPTVINEFDDMALEEGLLLKEETGGTLTVLALEGEGVADILYTALAKGADRAVRVAHTLEPPISSRQRALVLAQALRTLPHDLILTGVQSPEDREGQVAPFLATALGLPWVEVVTGVQVQDGRAVVRKEFKGGLMAEYEVDLPAVLGVQTARKPPRYAPIGRIRQMMQSASLDSLDIGTPPDPPAVPLEGLTKPVAARQAEILQGSTEEVVERLVEVLKTHGLVKG